MTQVIENQAEQKQSRLGKRGISIPAGVQVSIQGDKISVQGKSGKLERAIPKEVKVAQEGSELTVKIREGVGSVGPRIQGLVRSILNGVIEGAEKGFSSSMDLHGVGYKADVSGEMLTMSLGLSHIVKMKVPQAVKMRVEIIDEGGQKRPRLHLTSADKELLGQVMAKIRAARPPEPYKGKGVRITGEKVREKAGKAASKGKK